MPLRTPNPPTSQPPAPENPSPTTATPPTDCATTRSSPPDGAFVAAHHRGTQDLAVIVVPDLQLGATARRRQPDRHQQRAGSGCQAVPTPLQGDVTCLGIASRLTPGRGRCPPFPPKLRAQTPGGLSPPHTFRPSPCRVSDGRKAYGGTRTAPFFPGGHTTPFCHTDGLTDALRASESPFDPPTKKGGPLWEGEPVHPEPEPSPEGRLSEGWNALHRPGGSRGSKT